MAIMKRAMPGTRRTILFNSCRQNSTGIKKPRRGGVFIIDGIDRLVGAGADHFDFHATVLGAAFLGAVVSHWLLLALAFGVDAVAFDALRDQEGLDGFGATHRQTLVVGVRTDRVGVA